MSAVVYCNRHPAREMAKEADFWVKNKLARELDLYSEVK
jgi:hypothetical protein